MAINVELDTSNESAVRATALALAVVHHGMSCLADGSVPARSGTVMQTAVDFEDYINGVPITDQRRKR